MCIQYPVLGFELTTFCTSSPITRAATQLSKLLWQAFIWFKFINIPKAKISAFFMLSFEQRTTF